MNDNVRILVFNEDNSAYGTGCKYGGPLTEEGLRDYVRRIGAASIVAEARAGRIPLAFSSACP